MRSIILIILLLPNLISTTNSLQCNPEEVIKAFPFLVHILVGNETFCTGTLVSAAWVLTSSHCAPPPGPESVVVLAANQQRSRSVRHVLVYPRSNRQDADKPYENDLALLKVDTPFKVSATGLQYMTPADLAKGRVFCVTVGYGLDSVGGASNKWACSRLEVFDSLWCRDMNPSYPWEQQVCARSASSCVWTNGGPLVCSAGDNMKLVGVVSGAVTSDPRTKSNWACPNTTMVFTLAESYREWMDWAMRGGRVARSGAPLSAELNQGGVALACGAVPKLGNFPYLALVEAGDVFCTGTLLTASWVLTTAHCMWGPAQDIHYQAVPATSISVKAGVVHYFGNIKPLQVRHGEIFNLHPQFNPNPSVEERMTPFKYDVALLKVSQPFDLDARVNTVGLSRMGPRCMAVGYRLRAHHFELSCLTLRPGNRAHCVAASPAYPWTPGELCAITPKGQHCFNDSGSPLVCVTRHNKMALVGLVNGHAQLNASTARSGVFCETQDGNSVVITAIDYYNDWIMSFISGARSQPRVEVERNFSPRLRDARGKEMYLAVISFKLVLGHLNL